MTETPGQEAQVVDGVAEGEQGAQKTEVDGAEDLREALLLLKEKMSTLDDQTREALLLIIRKAQDQMNQDSLALQAELQQRSREAFGENMSETPTGKNAVAFLGASTPEDFAKMVDNNTFTENQVKLFAELHRIRQGAF